MLVLLSNVFIHSVHYGKNLTKTVTAEYVMCSRWPARSVEGQELYRMKFFSKNKGTAHD